MTVLFRCDCCGRPEPVSDRMEETIRPPGGWRRIRTVIDEFREVGIVSRHSELTHSCDGCNSNMSLDEHIEAEHEGRLKAMEQREAI